MAKFCGIHAVLYALFDSEGRLDSGAMRAQTQVITDNGIDGITVLGLATEVHKLTVTERQRIICDVSGQLSGKVPFSVTVTGNSVQEQREMVRFALDHGADWLILQPPVVGNYSGNVFLDFFASVAEGFDHPFAIQNAPQYLGRSLSSADVKRLTERNRYFSLIKAECSAVDVAGLIGATDGGLTVLNGRGGLEMTDCLCAGAQGFVLAPDVIDISKHVFDLWSQQSFEDATAVYAQVLPAIVFVMQSIEHFICYGKRLFGMRAGFTIHDRAPALAPTDFGYRMTRQWADRLGAFGTHAYQANPDGLT